MILSPFAQPFGLKGFPRTSSLSFTLQSLFANGESGALYTPWDLSTMFQDYVGTAAAVDSPVKLRLDMRAGNPLDNLGSELVTNGGFDTDSDWAKGTGWSIAGGVASASSVNHPSFLTQSPAGLTEGAVYEVRFTVSNRSAGTCGVQLGAAGNFFGVASNGDKIMYLRAASVSSADEIRIRGLSSFTGNIDNISVKEIPGNHAYQDTDSKRAMLRQDGAGNYYLEYDGVDDCFVTSAIDFTGTNKMAVFAAIRKEDDVSTRLVAELSANMNNNNGAFFVSAPYASGDEFGVGWRGSAAANAGYIEDTDYAQPITLCQTALLDLAGATRSDVAKLRLAGVEQSLSFAVDAIGGGNFGNYALNIGSRNQSSLFFKGREYGLCIVGAIPSLANIVKAENLLNGKAGL